MKTDRRDFLRLSSAALLLAQSKPSSAFPIPTFLTGRTSPVAGKEVAVYTTADKTEYRLSATGTVPFKRMGQPLETQICVFVDAARTFQTFLGIGGALTDAAAEAFAKLRTNKQQEIVNAYFNATTGIGYTLARTNIHSCDFSSSSYTYVDEGDKELQSFSVDHDKRFRIPFIKQALQVAGKINIFGSPWSPPAFMKDNNDMLH